MKYKIIRVLDVAGLKVLEPIVRLAYGEEPRVQIKKIGLFICVPIVTFLVFLSAWSYIGPRHKTKSGEVPGPMTVVDAWKGIVQFADRENAKGKDFKLAGDKRTATLEQVRVELQSVEHQLAVSKNRFATLDAKRTEAIGDKLAKYDDLIASKQSEYDNLDKQRENELRVAASKVTKDNVEARTTYLKLIQKHLAHQEKQAAHIKKLQSELAERRAEKWPVLESERKNKNALEQSRQFLKKRIAYLSKSSREAKIASADTTVQEAKQAYMSATGPAMFDAGIKVVKASERLKTTASAEYAQPPTFFMYIRTSLACVFLGFLIATAIAIPIGILCGLSPVFMAAMSPLISLFKPVSPIVWLPIVFIIVGGFNIPEVTGDWAWLFTPSFLASAITVALCSLWPTLVNTALGVSSIDKDHLNVARVLRLGFWSRLFKIVIPSALPLIFTGLRISLGVGWMVLIAAELLSSSPGLGKFVWDMFNNGSSETFSQMFVVVFVVGLIGLLLDRIMIVFQRLVSFDGAATAL